MNAALYRFRAEIRHGGWRFIVGTSLLLGIVGGLALLSAAGARRTASAFERLAQATNASEVLVNPESDEVRQAIPPDQIAEIEGVEAVVSADGIVTIIDGRPVNTGVLTSSDAGWFDTIDRPVVRVGRLPNQSRPDEVFANPGGARIAGISVGDRFGLVTVSLDELTEELMAGDDSFERVVELANSGVVGERIEASLVGIGVTTSDVVPGAGNDSVYLTRAFAERRAFTPIFGGTLVRLSNGNAGVDPFTDQVRELARANSSEEAALIDFQTLDADRQTVRRAVRPQVLALAAFALALAAAAAMVTAQVLGRRAGLMRDSDDVLAALGMTGTERRSLDWMRLGAVAGLGAVVAPTIAAALSPLTPVGVARDVEPTPGLAVDAVALVGGGLLLGLAVVALGVISTLRARRDASASHRPSLVALWLRGRATGAPMVTGVGMALEPGAGRTSVPTRSTLVAAASGITAVVTTLTFAAGLANLLDSPSSYGSNFDINVQQDQLDGEQAVPALKQLAKVLDADPQVDSWSQLYVEQVSLSSGVVPANALGVEKKSVRAGTDAGPTLVRGRLPVGPREVALGALTLRTGSVDLGDTIDVRRGTAQQATPFTVVGQVVLPGASAYAASDQAALGVGALFSVEGLAGLIGGVPFTRDAPADAATPRAILIRVAEGASVDEVSERLAAAFPPGNFVIGGSIRSSDVQSLDRVRSTPLLLAAVLGLVAIVAVANALVVTVRRRRIDFAVLRTLGFTPGQVSRAVGWHATVVGLVGALIGIPAGIVAGRAAWGAVARQLGVVEAPVVPWGVLLVLPLAVVFANVVAFVPGWRAARLRPAEILRSE